MVILNEGSDGSFYCNDCDLAAVMMMIVEFDGSASFF